MNPVNYRALKAQVRERLSHAQVSPRVITALYLVLLLLFSLPNSASSSADLTKWPHSYLFLYLLCLLIGNVLEAGYVLYCMTVNRRERAEYQILSGGFPFAGKITLVYLLQNVLIAICSFFFIIPGLIAFYACRFALYNLCDNPSLSASAALRLSNTQTKGYKRQLLALDLSYLPWMFLANVPRLLQTWYLSLAEAGLETSPGILSIVSQSGFGWILFAGLWRLGVSLFYLPNYYCVSLTVFEAAKYTASQNRDEYL